VPPRGPDDKVATIARTLERLGELDADALITYNSRDFDLDFLNERLRANERADVAAHLNRTFHTSISILNANDSPTAAGTNGPGSRSASRRMATLNR